jgi:hypothetical protein
VHSPLATIRNALAAAPAALRALLALEVTALFVVGYLGARLEAATIMANAALVDSRETLYVPDTRTTRLAFLGYDQAAADVSWLRTVAYFARKFAGDRQYHWLPHFVDQVIALDPKFRRVYHWAGASVLYGQRFTNNNVRLSNRFYEAALAQFPDDNEAALRLGLNFYVEMRGTTPEESTRFKEKGAQYIEMAANMPGAPLRTRQLAAGIYSRMGDSALAVQSLLQMLESTEDPQQRAWLRNRIAELEATGMGSELARQVEAFEARRKATFPYLTPAFYLLIDAHAGATVADRTWRELLPDVSVGAAAPTVEER